MKIGSMSKKHIMDPDPDPSLFKIRINNFVCLVLFCRNNSAHFGKKKPLIRLKSKFSQIVLYV